MSRHHHRERCGRRQDHHRAPAYIVYPIGPMHGGCPEPEPDPCFNMPSGPMGTMPGGGSCFMSPQGPVCPGQQEDWGM